jgi:hypothetical protein
VATDDNRKEIIETTGSIVVNLAKLAVAFGAPPEQTSVQLNLPSVIDLSDAKQDPGAEKDLPGNPGWTYLLTFLDDPAAMGHYPRSVLDAPSRIKFAAVTSVCRSARLSLKSPVNKLDFGLSVVPDPDFVQTVKLPVQGSVEFHDVCGFDVKTEKETVTSTTDLANALFKQIDDIRQAFKTSAPAKAATPVPTKTTNPSKADAATPKEK